MIQKLFTTMLFAAATTTAVAQLKVLQDGKTFLQNSNTKGAAILNVGKIPYDYNFFSQDTSSVSMGIYAQSVRKPNKTINIGVMGETYHQNNSGTAIGVWGYGRGGANNQNYGIYGLIYPSNSGAAILGSTYSLMPPQFNGQYAGYFNGYVYVTHDITTHGLYNLSDIRLKSNIKSLNDLSDTKSRTLDLMMRMNVLEYNMNYPECQKDSSFELPEEIRKAEEDRMERRHFGLSAQELREIYPNLVLERQNGYLAVNYIELVPLLIQSIQELKQELDELRGSGSEKVIHRAKQTAVESEIVSTHTEARLYQNTPNPFTEKTTIRFDLPSDAQNACIYIFDMSGKMLRQIPVTPDMTSITINGYELPAGMYIYSLAINGQEVETKRMILSK